MIKETIGKVGSFLREAQIRAYTVGNFVMDLVVPSWLPEDSREIACDWICDTFEEFLSGGSYLKLETNPIMKAAAALVVWGTRLARRLVSRALATIKGE